MSMILILGIVAYLVYNHMERKHGVTEESPLEILKKRYARGEINFEEFTQIKKDIE